MKVFICSPFAGDKGKNLMSALSYCQMAVDQGNTPFAPHAFFPLFLSDNDPDQRWKGIQMGLEFLELCDEIWVFGEPSPGMKKEILHAKAHNIPVRYFTKRGHLAVPEERTPNHE